MPVDHGRKLLFIHIPKTGGTTILSMLGLWKKERSPDLSTLFGDFGPFDLQHLTLSQARQFLTRAEWTSYFRFAFVRNPWDRAVSSALWRTRFRDEGIRDLRDYIDWAERVNRNGPRARSDVHALPQSAFVINDDGSPGVHCIGRFENYERDVQAILSPFLRVYRPLPHNLKHLDRGHYRDYYHGDLEGRTRRLYTQDVERFGYSF
jgi:hypothetical protein